MIPKILTRNKVAKTLLAASIVRYAGQIAIFTLIARLSGPTDAGLYALALGLTAPVFILSGLGMRTVYLTLLTPVAATEYEKLRTSTAIGSVILLTVACVLAKPEFALVIAVVACSKAFDAYNDLYNAILQKASRSALTLRTSLAVGTTQVIVLGGVLLAGAPMVYALLAGMLGYGISTRFYVRNIALAESPSTTPLHGEILHRPWLEIIRAGLPTGISDGLLTLLTVMPQYFLGLERGPVDVGRYATLMYLVVVVEMMLNALAQSWIPTGRALDGRGELTGMLILKRGAKWIPVVLPFGLLAMSVAYWLFPHILGPTYAFSSSEFFPLGVAMVFTPLVFSTGTSLAIQNKYLSSLMMSAGTVVFGAFLGWELIGRYGVKGGLWAYAICVILKAIVGFGFVVTQRTENIDIPLEPAWDN